MHISLTLLNGKRTYTGRPRAYCGFGSRPLPQSECLLKVSRNRFADTGVLLSV